MPAPAYSLVLLGLVLYLTEGALNVHHVTAAINLKTVGGGGAVNVDRALSCGTAAIWNASQLSTFVRLTKNLLLSPDLFIHFQFLSVSNNTG